MISLASFPGNSPLSLFSFPHVLGVLSLLLPAPQQYIDLSIVQSSLHHAPAGRTSIPSRNRMQQNKLRGSPGNEHGAAFGREDSYNLFFSSPPRSSAAYQFIHLSTKLSPCPLPQAGLISSYPIPSSDRMGMQMWIPPGIEAQARETEGNYRQRSPRPPAIHPRRRWLGKESSRILDWILQTMDGYMAYMPVDCCACLLSIRTTTTTTTKKTAMRRQNG